MYASRLTNHTHYDPLNNTLPTLSPRLYSFAEPNSRNTSLHLHNYSSQSSISISNFIKDFQLLQRSIEVTETLTKEGKISIGHIAMINGNDKKQVKQALEEQSIEKNIKNRMNKYLKILQKVGSWDHQQSAQHKKQLNNAQKNMKDSIIMEILPHETDPKKYVSEPTVQYNSHHSTLSPFRISSSRYQKSPVKQNITQNSRVMNEKQNKSGSKQKSVSSSKASHSKVFKKIELKSVNYASQLEKEKEKKQFLHKNSRTNSQKMVNNQQKIRKSSSINNPSRKTVSPAKNANIHNKNNVKKTQIAKEKYKISKRSEPQKQNTKYETKMRQKSNINASRSKSRSIQCSRVSIGNNAQKSARKSNMRKIENSGNKLTNENEKRMNNIYEGRQSLHRSRLKQQVSKLQKNQVKGYQQKGIEIVSNKSNNNLLKQTMEKTCMFLDMVRMMDK